MKKSTIIVLTVAIILLMVGCGLLSRDGDHRKDAVPPGPGEENIKLTLYFANDEYIQTGDANLDVLLVEEREVTLGDQTSAEAAMRELMKGPNHGGMSIVIPERISLKSVEVADNIAYVNFSGEGLWGGSLEEGILVSSTVMTLTELEDIEAVQFLVDGKKAESLMGHISAMEPISRDDD